MYYTHQKHSKLKHPFPGSENIKINQAQAAQDIFVLMMLNGKRNGTYLEIGANEPTNISNTYLLESEFGWNGISIDLYDFGEFKKHRTSTHILADALTLDYKSLLDEHSFPKQIDYLSLDIDPPLATLNVLKKLPLDQFRFSVITFEHADYMNESRDILNESRDIITSFGYQLIAPNISNAGDRGASFEDWYVDPTVVDKEIINKIIINNNNVNFCDSVILFD